MDVKDVTMRHPSRAIARARQERQVKRYERVLRGIRWVAFGWTAFAALTFLLLRVFPKDGLVPEARRVFVLGAVVHAGFAACLAWRSPKGNIRALFSRVGRLLGWQAASGVFVVFTLAVQAETTMQQSFGLVGMYLLVSVIFYVAFTLASAGLQGNDEALAQLQVEDERRELMNRLEEIANELTALRAFRRRPRWWQGTR